METYGLPPSELCALMIRAFEHCAGYSGEVPGASPVNCGNYLLHDLPTARYEAARYARLLHEKPCFEYPKTRRITTEKGMTFKKE